MNTPTAKTLPIETILAALKQALCKRHEVVLKAPPGAGKTTYVPLALLNAPWLKGKKILILEPRRIAARSAAARMADLLNEPVGQTIGYRMRFDTKVSQHTKIEVITEGILLRMLQNDPSLEDVGLVIFDEFHERSMDADIALALCMHGRKIFRNEGEGEQALKLLIMSATLDSDQISNLLNDAPVIISEGQSFSVDVIYSAPYQTKDNMIDRVVATTKLAITDNPESNLLIFLPGQGEIRRVESALSTWLNIKNMSQYKLCPMYGNLSIEQQQAAIAPISANEFETGTRKIVLATNIAETSLTIEGINVVIDAGLERQAYFDHNTALTRLRTHKISKSSSIQRTGRAGRLRPGKCYRLWSEAQQQLLAATKTAEILQADIAPLALQLLQFGVDNPRDLNWIDPPKAPAWQQALALLNKLNATRETKQGLSLSEHGKMMANLPAHPRLAHLLLMGQKIGNAKTATLIASLLSDRDPFQQTSARIDDRLEILLGEATCPPQYRSWKSRTLETAKNFRVHLDQINLSMAVPAAINSMDVTTLIAYLVCCAYPDRVAKKRHSGGYQLANGRSAKLPQVRGSHATSLANSAWLAVAQMGNYNQNQGDMIQLAASLPTALFNDLLQDLCYTKKIAEWDKQSNRFVAEERQQIGVLVLNRKKIEPVPREAKDAALIDYLRAQGLSKLNWSPTLKQFQHRANILHAHYSQTIPNFADSFLLDTLNIWLKPYLSAVNTLNDFKKINLEDALKSRLSWQQKQKLEDLVPTHFKVPSGSNIRIDYSVQPPSLPVKLQEMFGLEQTPSILNGALKLTVHLLSPAGRPLQVTQDLAGFWRTSYHQVKKEMKGRYPKHPWPDDPLSAKATGFTKNRIK